MITYSRRSAFRKLTQQVLEGFNAYDVHRGENTQVERRCRFLVQVRLNALARLLDEFTPFSGDIETWFQGIVQETLAKQHCFDPEADFGLLSSPLYFDAATRGAASARPAKGHLSREAPGLAAE